MPRKASTTKKSAPVKATPTSKPKPQVSTKPILTIDMSTVESLVALLEQSKLTELELDTGEARLYISKNGPSMSAPATYAMPQAAAAAPVAVSAESKKSDAPSSNRKLAEVTSPMVGTFYATPSPDADAYVHEGQNIKEGQTLCIIEAMKLMNEIEAEVTGRVVEICVKNGQPVEFGTVLFRIEPSV